MQQVIAAALVIAALVPTSRQASAAEDAVGWADVVEHALPAVVNITVQKIVSDNAGRGRRETFFGSGFVIDSGWCDRHQQARNRWGVRDHGHIR
jgi:S1-C subfamily serine protease